LHDPGARAYYDELRARELGHNAALRQHANPVNTPVNTSSCTSAFAEH
jgi:hypothetical protein